MGTRRRKSPDAKGLATGISSVSALRSPVTVVVAAALLRFSLLYAAHENPNIAFQAIGQEAGNIAMSIAAGRGFSGPIVGMQGPTALLPPVYPYLLALGFLLFHITPLANVIYGQILNCMFAALTCWPVYLIGKKVFSERIGWSSAWLWAVLPTAILMPLEWTWDQSLSALLLACLIYFTLYLRDSTRALAWLGYGLLWAFSLLTNPSLGIALPFFLGWLFVRRSKESLPWARPIGTAVLACALGILPWMVRNYAALGQFVPVRSNFGVEFWLGNNSDVKIIWTWWRSPLSDAREFGELRQLGELPYMREKQREAIVFIKAHPGVFLDSCFDRFVDTWTALWDSHADPWVVALGVGTEYVAFNTIFSLLAFFGLLAARREYGVEVVPFSTALLFLPATYYITHSAVRYRHPIEPIMTVLAVYAVAHAWSSATKETTQPEQTNRQQRRERARRAPAPLPQEDGSGFRS